jgi:hypothetical protein
MVFPPLNIRPKRTFIRIICSTQPQYMLLLGLVPGFSLIAGSLVLGVDSLKASSPEFAVTTREVGYLAALNWSLGYALLLPILLYLMASTLSGLAQAMERLHSRDMVYDSDLQPAPKSALTQTWLDGSLFRTLLMFAFAICIPTFIAIREWYRNNFKRLNNPPGQLEPWNYDWGLAGIMPAIGARMVTCRSDVERNIRSDGIWS